MGRHLSDPAGAHDRAVRAGGADRHRRAAADAEARRPSAQAVLCRERRRRGRQPRHARGGASRPRRLYPCARLLELHGQSEPLSQGPIRSGEGLRPGNSSRLCAERSGRQPVATGKTVKELAEFVRANPGKLSFASAGMGTTPYLSAELFKLSLGADLVHVPLNGSAPAIQSTLGGHTQFAFVVLAPAVPHIREGSLRGLAVLSAERSSALPDVPTIAE